MLLIFKPKTSSHLRLIALFSFFTISFYAQVGVGTTLPKGALDITSATTGFIMPRIALTATNVSAPVTNPNGVTLEVGTMVFNTNTTAGTYGVIPGLYFWDGVKWVSQIHRNYKTSFTQSAVLSVASTAATYSNIVGLNSKSFIAPYDGEYQIIFSGYLGATPVNKKTTNVGASKDIDGYAATGFVEGNFRLTVNGTNYDKYSYSVSLYRSSNGSNGSGGSDLYELFNEITIIVTINLTAGATCNLNGAYTGADDDNTTTATPHVIGSLGSLGNKCEINVAYMGR
ncbi:hypothetical protein [Flavobacterium sp. GT3R68]|uniref:hypothetical protein n=1 Tax=Flavobacterium sp. GT3R68 TaxID=2594437 RepID=UPI000F880C04|nr:hypothetical protein [Flavobacterium sp. GT3R68]RTY95932.1 hypothetical protein EKL32_04610 [Flavobacterium sp. GSN2]TRW93704.1 hypothetical protein FNW07_02000 [Flavobacterium sp. GT3R68]